MSQTCQRIRSLEIIVHGNVTDELASLIYVQRNLKRLSVIDYFGDVCLVKIVPSIMNLSNDGLIGLQVRGGTDFTLSSLVTRFTNLRALDLSYCARAVCVAPR